MSNANLTTKSPEIEAFEQEKGISMLQEAFGNAPNKLVEKFYVLRHKNAYEHINLYLLIPSSVSIVLGTLTTMLAFFGQSIIVATILGSILSSIVEGVKQVCLHYGLPTFVKYKRVNLSLIGGAVMLLGSFLMSVYGAVNGHRMNEDRELLAASAAISAQKDSVENAYNNMIKSAEKMAETYRHDNKVNDIKAGVILGYGARKQYDSLISNITSLSNKKLEALASVESLKPSILSEIKVDMSIGFWVAVAFAVMIEVVIFRMTYFKYYYQFKQSQEREWLERASQKDSKIVETLIRAVTVVSNPEWLQQNKTITASLSLNNTPSNTHNNPSSGGIGFVYNKGGGGAATPITVSPASPAQTPPPPAPATPTVYSAGQQVNLSQTWGDVLAVAQQIPFLAANLEAVKALWEGKSLMGAAKDARAVGKSDSRSHIQNVKRAMKTHNLL